MRAGRLGFAKLSTCVLNLANPRVERVRLQRMRTTTLGFAKPSIWVLDLANPRVERGGHAKDDGGDTQTCQTEHTGARFGTCEGVGGGPPKDDGERHSNLLNQAPVCSIWQFRELGGWLGLQN